MQSTKRERLTTQLEIISDCSVRFGLVLSLSSFFRQAKSTIANRCVKPMRLFRYGLWYGSYAQRISDCLSNEFNKMCNAFGIYHMRACVCVFVCSLYNKEWMFPYFLNQKKNTAEQNEKLKNYSFNFILYMPAIHIHWVVELVLFVRFKSHFYLYSCLNYWAQMIFCYSILCHGKCCVEWCVDQSQT